MLTLLPAYGRDYTSRGAAQADLDLGKDFRDATSERYVNREELARLGVVEVKARPMNLRKVWVLRVHKDEKRSVPRTAQDELPGYSLSNIRPTVGDALRHKFSRRRA